MYDGMAIDQAGFWQLPSLSQAFCNTHHPTTRKTGVDETNGAFYRKISHSVQSVV